MPQTQYNLHLKGFVGGADFDRNYVDYVLAKNGGKKVNVLIDSLGNNRFEAIDTENSSIRPGDTFSCLMFQKGRPLYMDMFQRYGEPADSAANARYAVGQDNGLSAVEILHTTLSN